MTSYVDNEQATPPKVSGSRYFTRDVQASLGTVALPTTEVEMPEWTPGYDVHTDSLPEGVEAVRVILRGFTGAEADRMANLREKGTIKETEYRARLLSMAIIDEAGRRVFDSRGSADVDWLEAQSARSTNRLIAALTDLNRDTDEAAKDAEKNYERDRENGSSTI